MVEDGLRGIKMLDTSSISCYDRKKKKGDDVKMTKQLSTKLYKLNFRELIDNATNRAYWTKKWEIFQYDGIS